MAGEGLAHMADLVRSYFTMDTTFQFNIIDERTQVEAKKNWENASTIIKSSWI